jgi:hypothetical protein
MKIPPAVASRILLALSLAATRVLAQTDGTLDPAFDLDGAVRIPFDLGATLRDVPVAVAVQGDGKLVVLGTAALALQGGRPILVGPAEWSAPDYDFGVMRLTSSLIFADDLERGSTGGWSAATP